MSGWQDISTAPRDGSEFDARCGLYPAVAAYFNGSVFVHFDQEDGEIAYPFSHWQPRQKEWRCSECGAAADERWNCCQAFLETAPRAGEDG